MLHVIGLGVSEQAQLSDEARQALRNCAAVIGSPRQLETLEHIVKTEQKQHLLPPMTELAELLETYTQSDVCLLASGDPLYYGIGRWLLKRYPQSKLRFYPAVSSIQAVCHALGLALQDVHVVSLHGRPIATLRRHLGKHALMLCLTDAHSTPQALAQICCDTGYAKSRLWLCERMGYSNQQIREFEVIDVLQQTLEVDPLNICVLEIKAGLTDQQHGKTESATNAPYLSSAPGIADEHFVTDVDVGKGLLTKREVRMAILGLLPTHPKGVFWDIGAGCGGVTVEWALLQQQSQVYGIEHHAQRLSCLKANRQRFGVVDNLTVIGQRAPDCLADLPHPDAVFIGGSDGELEALLALCWQRLTGGGVLVASAVTETSKATLLQFIDSLMLPDTCVETLQIAVSKGSKLAGQWVYRPKLPVTLFRLSKESINQKDDE